MENNQILFREINTPIALNCHVCRIINVENVNKNICNKNMNYKAFNSKKFFVNSCDFFFLSILLTLALFFFHLLLPYSASFCLILPHFASFHLILPHSISFCPILPHSTQSPSFETKISRCDQSMHFFYFLCWLNVEALKYLWNWLANWIVCASNCKC